MAKKADRQSNSHFPADVVIYGGTSAAVIAAVQLACMKKSVIIISPDPHLGGMSSSGLGFTDIGNKSVIGGLARRFYQLVFQHYQKPEAWVWQKQSEYGNVGQGDAATDPQAQTMWIFEPHVAESIFEDLTKKYCIQVFKKEFLDRTKGVFKKRNSITSIRTLSGKVFKAKIFIDATYEGDLLAAADVSYHLGREACDIYGETWNGVQPEVFQHPHHFEQNISAYVIPGKPSSGIVPRINSQCPGARCQGDRKIQAYTFRLTLTKHPENRVPITRPDRYDPGQYELLGRVFEAGWNEFFAKFDPIPNLKTDVNNHGPFSFDNIGMNYDYPEASYRRRKKILEEHERYQKGLLYFVLTDRRVPAKIRNELKKWGYAKDEFVDNGHWPYLVYVREARRLIGEHVMTENEILGKKKVPKSIGMGSYVMDSHNVQRYITQEGFVQNEGDIGVVPPNPYQIALGTILPKQNECNNLLVPVAVSSSHIAFGSIRMEPVFMVLGQSAGTLAGLALETRTSLHGVPYRKLRRALEKGGQILTLS